MVQGEVYFCRARGRLKKEGFKLPVGSLVKLKPLKPGEGIIEDVLPHANLLYRPSIANVTQIVIVMSANIPKPDFSLLDRLLIYAEKVQLKILICFNKIDLADHDELACDIDPYIKASYSVSLVSALQGTGIEDLHKALRGTVSVLAGPSGVGKSTILNNIKPGINLQVKEVSKKSKGGRHTTRQVSLISLENGGFVADTPGFSRFDFQGIMPEDLGDLYPEIVRNRQGCRFRDCLHEHEPGCKVKEAMQRGDFATVRYYRYISFLNELRDIRQREV